MAVSALSNNHLPCNFRPVERERGPPGDCVQTNRLHEDNCLDFLIAAMNVWISIRCKSKQWSSCNPADLRQSLGGPLSRSTGLKLHGRWLLERALKAIDKFSYLPGVPDSKMASYDTLLATKSILEALLITPYVDPFVADVEYFAETMSSLYTATIESFKFIRHPQMAMTSASFLSEISVSSPRQLYIYIIFKTFSASKHPKKKSCSFEKGSTSNH